ncbi:M48 family metallopeptidase [Candidatus Laterigemmans baculatus]|uniref:M48 family metallopeptidase n=1 Tax=Candidatus Laterigemmans baculatus TaxID=2770505 RepID=UPI0013DB91E7|nr:M48 family metallopeptidase [Candidatus Laterigemmans baculatus]
MATDFFERQSRARSNTTRLIVLFALAVVSLVTAAGGLTAAALYWSGEYDFAGSEGGWEQNPLAGRTEPFPWELPIAAGVLTLLVIAGGSLFKIVSLRHGGGSGVAEGLGGSRLYPNASDPDHRRLLNVVEEMAIASGTPVPPVFLLEDEDGINAFAAGYAPSDAVVGITRGCVQSLTRDQLQGVVAHEFSHILNGDMRISIRLIGILHGILLLGTLGQILFRMVGYGAGSSSRRSSSDNKKGGSGILILLLVAIALIVLGSIGVFFGSLIRAAVSRQREFLADASAVQFTRNPGGLSGALKIIGGLTRGSLLQAPRAPEASHLFFAQGVAEGYSQLMATHPPLAARIKAIDPAWDGVYPPVEPLSKRRRAARKAEQQAASLAESAVPSAGRSFPAHPSSGEWAAVGGEAEAGGPGDWGQSFPPEAVFAAAEVRNAAERIGSPAEAHRRQAAELLSRIPDPLRAAVHEPYEAQAVVFALLLDRDRAIRDKQLATLKHTAGGAIVRWTERWFAALGELDSLVRLPLIDLSLPALRSMTDGQYRTFDRAVLALIAADERMDLFEWTLSQVLMRHLQSQFKTLPAIRYDYYAIGRLGEECSLLLSSLAHVGHSEAESKAAFAIGARLVSDARPEWLPKSACTLTRLDSAVRKLATVTTRHRERILAACAECVCADGEVKASEAELLRGVADLLACPMPPYLTT